MKIILGGHWEDYLEGGWIALTEQQQDMRKPLQWQDNSIDAIFTEHVQEHLTLVENLFFLKEALRVLRPGGILRTVMPTINKMIQFQNNDLGKHYSDVQTSHYYPNEDYALKELGLEGIREEPIAFMMDSLFKGHNHRFLWTSELYRKVAEKIGFSDVRTLEPGQSAFDISNCLERRVRGIDPNFLTNNSLPPVYDPESSVIEAKK